tara:strand:+ start:757 stop:1380 length:624 start_codon:yes stop_codon:yes gene_type:complete
MSIKLNAQSGGSVALDAPTQTTSSADLTFKLPVADGSANQLLKTDGSGNLGFVTSAVGGKVLQTVESGDFSSQTSTSSTTFQDTSLTATITPSASNSKVLVLVSGSSFITGTSYNVYGEIRLLRGTTEIARIDHMYDANQGLGARLGLTFTMNRLDTPSTDQATTYKVQIRVAGTNYGATIKVPSLQYGNATEKYVGNKIQLLEIGA